LISSEYLKLKKV